MQHTRQQQQQTPAPPQEEAQELTTEEISRQVEALKSTFNKIYLERMHDIPIINDRIKVSVIGFQRWQNSRLCIMITPWFMNIMLLPGDNENWESLQETSTVSHSFPSGRYEFLVGFEPGIGKYQMCSLFSPMFEFADNNAAMETAQAVINELMNIENIETGDINSNQIENIWNGTEEHPNRVKDDSAISQPTEGVKTTSARRHNLKENLAEKMNKPVSRRQLLRGAIMLEKHDADKINPGCK